jgi:ferredoxin
MIEIISELCIKCGYCVETCPSNVFIMDQDIVRVEFEDYYILCGQCIAICPEDAIHHERLEYIKFKKVIINQIDPQDLYIVFQTRRSIRNFEEKVISQDLVEQIISEARYAPTGSNLQNVKCLILQNQAIPPFVKNERNFYVNILKIFES